MGQRRPRPLRVLVVEDDPELGQMLALALRRTDMQVVAARDGISAVEEARRFDPHVAIIDLGLPHLGGHELGRQLKSIRPESGLPHLVAVTGDSRAATRQASLDAGFVAHLVKPASPKELAELVRELAGAEEGVGEG